MQQVPLMRAEDAISSFREVRDLEGSSVRAAPSQRSFPRGSGVPVFFHTHTCSNKSSLLFSAHADHEVPLQMRLLSWSAGVQIFAITCSLPAWRLEQGADPRSSVFCTFASVPGGCCSSPWSCCGAVFHSEYYSRFMSYCTGTVDLIQWGSRSILSFFLTSQKTCKKCHESILSTVWLVTSKVHNSRYARTQFSTNKKPKRSPLKGESENFARFKTWSKHFLKVWRDGTCLKFYYRTSHFKPEVLLFDEKLPIESGAQSVKP